MNAVRMVRFLRTGLLREYSLLLAPALVDALFAFALIPYYAHFLGIAKYGVYIGITVITNVFIAAIEFNLRPVLVRLFNREELKASVGASFLFTKGCIICLVIAGASVYIGLSTNDSETRYTYALFLLAAIVNPSHFDWFFIARGSLRPLCKLKTVHSVLKFAFPFLFLPYYQSMISIACGVALASILVFGAYITWLSPLWQRLGTVSIQLSWSMIREALPLASVQVVTPYGIYFGVKAFETFFGESLMLGAYAIGQKVALSGILLAHPLVTTLMARMARDYSTDDCSVESYTKKIASVVGLISIPVLFLAPLAIQILFPAFHRESADLSAYSHYVLRILLVAVMFMYIRAPIIGYLLSRGKTLTYASLHIIPIGLAFALMNLAGHYGRTDLIPIGAASAEVLITAASLLYMVFTNGSRRSR